MRKSIESINLGMGTDKRYNTVRQLFESGHIKSFSQILDTLPKTVLAQDLKIHHSKFNKLISHPEDWTFNQLFNIAALIGIDKLAVIALVLDNIAPQESPLNIQQIESIY